MKKLILVLVVIATVFTSCSNDDDSSQDPFIGSWEYFKYLADDVEQERDPCDYLGISEVFSDGTYNFIDYEDIGNGCELDAITSGTWKNLGQNSYVFDDRDVSTAQEFWFTGNTMYTINIVDGVTYKSIWIKE